MKEIVYRHSNMLQEVVAEGTYREVEYICVGGGSHPRAYIKCTQEFLDLHLDGIDYIPGITVHGGISHTGKINNLPGLGNYDGVYLGWDYGHAGDWEGFYPDISNVGNKKYTTEQLVEDCKRVIDQYLAIVEKDKVEVAKQVSPIFNLIPSTPLTKDYLKSIGFKPVGIIQEESDSALELSGEVEDGKWKVFFNFMSPSQTYVLNQNPRKKYEGVIATVEELQMAITLCQIPITL